MLPAPGNHFAAKGSETHLPNLWNLIRGNVEALTNVPVELPLRLVSFWRKRVKRVRESIVENREPSDVFARKDLL
ncbi:MAG: hypothetical protein M3Y69_06220 [Verrucomicrobiota bacterium]|nr:hypothetical protein [Verrucomicrobiota bacterium]